MYWLIEVAPERQFICLFANHTPRFRMEMMINRKFYREKTKKTEN